MGESGNMKQKKLEELFGLCVAVGAGVGISMFIIGLIDKQITEYGSQIEMIALGILMVGWIIRVSYSKIKCKDAVEIGLGVGVGLLLIMVGVTAYNTYEQQEYIQKYIEEQSRYFAYESKQKVIAFDMYNDNFTKDEEIMSALYVIRDIHPFLQKQMPILKEKMCILTNNITVDNYVDARDQYLFCMEMNVPYSENYTVYFDIFDEKYKEKFCWINEYSTPLPEPDEVGRWEFMFAIESDYDSRHDGFEVEWYSDELEYIGSQLDFISGIIGLEHE